MSKNAPCPFCGKKVKILYNARDRSYRVYHENPDASAKCLVKMPLIIQRTNISKARAAWNKAWSVRELELTRKFIHAHGLEFALISALSAEGGEQI